MQEQLLQIMGDHKINLPHDSLTSVNGAPALNGSNVKTVKTVPAPDPKDVPELNDEVRC